MVSLHQTQASWNREERERINENWQRIAESFAAVQRQITILTGGEEIEDLLTRIEQALNNAETSVQQYINQVDTKVQESLNTVSQALGEITQIVSAAETATADTTAAKNAAIQVTRDAEAAIANMQGLINNFKPTGAWSSAVTYYTNNLAEDGGRTYIALKENINTPVTDKNTWAIFADKGAKGDPGEKGEPGAGLNVIGSLPDISDLPTTGEPGDAYMIGRNLYMWDEILGKWDDKGVFQGPAGEKGESAYQVAVRAGFVGTEAEWLASLKGKQGEPGPQGPPGQDADLTPVQQELDNHASRLVALENDSTTVTADVSGLNREVAYLKLRQDTADRIKGGTTFADDYTGDRFGFELTATENVSIRYGKAILENISKTLVKPATTTVIDPTSGHSITRASGRKVVQLDNGKIVAVTKGAQYYYVFVSKDGTAWELAYTSTSVLSLQDVALEYKGNRAYLIIAYSNTAISMRSFDFTTSTMVTEAITVNAGSFVEVTTVSLAFNQDKSILGVAVQCRRSSRPNSSNIEYHSFGLDGLTATYLGYEEVTNINAEGNSYPSPTLIFKDNGYPLIVCSYSTGTTSVDLVAFNKNFRWTPTKITTVNNGNAVTDTSITRDIYGNIHVTFDYLPYVGYAKTTPLQNGLEWTVSPNLVSGASAGSVSTNTAGNVFIFYRTNASTAEMKYIKLESGDLTPDKFSSPVWLATGSPLEPKAVGFSPYEMPVPIVIFTFGNTINVMGNFTKVNSITPALTGSITYTIPNTGYVGLYLQIMGAIKAAFRINGELVPNEFLTDTSEYKVIKVISPEALVTLKIELSRTVTTGGENDAIIRLLGGRS